MNFDASLHSFYREALALRKKFPALVDGETQLIGADNSSRTFALARTGPETLVAAFNRSETTQIFRFRMGTTDGSSPPPLTPVFTSSGTMGEVTVKQDKTRVEVTLPGLTGVLLKQN